MNCLYKKVGFTLELSDSRFSAFWALVPVLFLGVSFLKKTWKFYWIFQNKQKKFKVQSYLKILWTTLKISEFLWKSFISICSCFEDMQHSGTIKRYENYIHLTLIEEKRIFGYRFDSHPPVSWSSPFKKTCLC